MERLRCWRTKRRRAVEKAHRNGTSGTILDDTLDAALLNFTYDRILEDNVHEALSELFPALQARRLRSNDDDWAQFVERCLAHPVRQLLHQDPFTYRAFLKPHGYAGDAVTLDYVYGRE
jgi:hypothetical protein